MLICCSAQGTAEKVRAGLLLSARGRLDLSTALQNLYELGSVEAEKTIAKIHMLSS